MVKKTWGSNPLRQMPLRQAIFSTWQCDWDFCLQKQQIKIHGKIQQKQAVYVDFILHVFSSALWSSYISCMRMIIKPYLCRICHYYKTNGLFFPGFFDSTETRYALRISLWLAVVTITKKSGRCTLPLFIIIICFSVRNRVFSETWLPHWNVSLQGASGCRLMPDWH